MSGEEGHNDNAEAPGGDDKDNAQQEHVAPNGDLRGARRRFAGPLPRPQRGYYSDLPRPAGAGLRNGTDGRHAHDRS
ncbi:hypothetical protein SDC9_148981 [bioreactor metagenome]|uniref:Uncharacterized protein n=1 Tax=bioreactor metagenome TaxID=1076179 RepID=A0A645EKW7_9ZZZZ